MKTLGYNWTVVSEPEVKYYDFLVEQWKTVHMRVIARLIAQSKSGNWSKFEVVGQLKFGYEWSYFNYTHSQLWGNNQNGNRIFTCTSGMYKAVANGTTDWKTFYSSGEQTIYHSAYGDASCSGGFHQWGDITADVTLDYRFYLPHINQKPVLKLLRSYNVRGHKASFEYQVPDSINFYHLDYELNGQVRRGGGNPYFTIEGLSPGTNYRLRIRGLNSNGSVYGDWSNTLYFTTLANGSITWAPSSFNDEQNPTISYSNPAGSDVEELTATISLDYYNDLVRRDIPKNTGGNYTFKLTEDERNKIRQACQTSNSRGLYFYIGCKIPGSSKAWSNKYSTVNIINADPGIPTISLSNVDSKTNSIIGTDKYIRRYSAVKVDITNAAAPRKKAYIARYIISCGKESKTIDGNGRNVIFYGVDANQINIKAIDSRGRSAETSKNIYPIYDYSQPFVQKMDIGRKDVVSTTALLTAEGTYTSYFGIVENPLTISIKDSSKEDSTYIDITGLLLLDKEEKIFLIKEKAIPTMIFDIDKTYNLTLKVSDLLSTIYLNAVIETGNVLISAKKGKGVGIGTVYDESIGGALQIKGKIYVNGTEVTTTKQGRSTFPPTFYPIGSAYFSFEEGDPSKFFGGTWEKVSNNILTESSDEQKTIIKIPINIWKKLS